LRVVGDLGPGAATARARLGVGDRLELSGGGSLRDGTIRITQGSIDLDLGAAAAAPGAPWAPAGRARRSALELGRRPGAAGLPSADGLFEVAKLGLPADAYGTPVEGEGLQGRLALRPAPDGGVLTTETQLARLVAAGVEMAPATARSRLTLARDGA